MTSAGSAVVANSSNTDIKADWTLSGGLEMALDEHWSINGDYLDQNAPRKPSDG
jgi:hypothetical protein